MKIIHLQEQFIDTNGVRYFVKKAGDNGAPLILFLHGFPDSWYSWKHQLTATAAVGYHAVAPDMLGCGETDAPSQIERYSQDEMAKDIVGIIDALDYDQAIIVGHDLGASLSWQISLLFPEKVKALVTLSIPYGGRALARPVEHMRKVFGQKFFYIIYFQEEGVAENEFDADVRETLLRIFYSLSAEGGERAQKFVASDNSNTAEKYLDTTILPNVLPDWLSEDDLAYYVSRYEKKGFRGIINWYRCLDIYWDRTEHLAGKKVTQPTLFIGGKKDPITYMVRKAIDRLPQLVEDLRGLEFIEDCGHWISSEQTEELNDRLLQFVKEIE